MTEERPLVTIVIPARNEEADIEACLAAVAAQEWPLDRLEVLVVDGASSDETAERAEVALRCLRLARGMVVCNPRGTTPSSLNVGLGLAQGEVLSRVDARSVIPPHYVRTCVAVLHRPDVAVVGGAQRATARPGAGVVSRGIARALRNPWAMGGSRYRRRAASGPSDTVYLGAFRTADLRAAGGWDEQLLTNQDFELNRRMACSGLVWFDSKLEVLYRPRATLQQLAHQYRRFGRWKAAGWLERRVPLGARQLALVAAPPVVVASVWPLIRRRPITMVCAFAAGALGLDSMVDDPASPAERTVAGAVMAITTAAWWSGVAEQAGRWLIGQRLIVE